MLLPSLVENGSAVLEKLVKMGKAYVQTGDERTTDDEQQVVGLCLKRVSSVSSRPDLDLFLFI